jgi:sialate O-acetylesterase
VDEDNGMESYELSVDQIFSNYMVLPRGKSFQISGMGVAGTTVKVTIGTVTQRAIVSRRCEWTCRFVPMLDLDHEFEVHIDDGTQKITLSHVRFGRVVLMAGQSNIGFRMAQDQDFKTEMSHFDLNQVAYYNVPQPSFVYQDGKVEEYQSHATHWHQLKAENMGHMSAVAFYMAKKMVESEPDVPVGIVCCTKDGALAPTWVSEATLRSNPTLLERVVRPFEAKLQGSTDQEFEEDVRYYREKVRRHNRRMYKFMKDNPSVPLGMAINVVGQTPWPPPMTPDSYLKPGRLFESMILKFCHFGFNQVVWYQGEGDTDHTDVYDQLLASTINDWRAAFQDFALPFYVMQLPKYADVKHHAWAEIRQQQLKVARKLDGVHLVSMADTGELYNPHPVAKRALGERLGRILAGDYYTDTPLLNRVRTTATATQFHIKYASQLHSTQGCFIEGFINDHWQAVTGKIQGNIIEVQFPDHTTKARYGYSNAPILTMYNENDDPVSPFLVDLTTGHLI